MVVGYFRGGYLFAHCCGESGSAYTEYDIENDCLWLIRGAHRHRVQQAATWLGYEET